MSDTPYDQLAAAKAANGAEAAETLIALLASHRSLADQAVWFGRQDEPLFLALEEAVARTIAGFLNHEGGTLLIGVTDTGEVAGLQADYQTLKRRDRDGFQQFLMSLVQSKLGGHVCAQVHVDFCEVRGMDVCRIMMEPSAAPVYCQDGRRGRRRISRISTWP